MVTKKQLKFVKYFFGMIFLFLGLVGTILPIMPGLVFIGIALTLLQDITFFKEIKINLESKMQSILPTSFKYMSKKYRHEKEIIT